LSRLFLLLSEYYRYITIATTHDGPTGMNGCVLNAIAPSRRRRRISTRRRTTRLYLLGGNKIIV